MTRHVAPLWVRVQIMDDANNVLASATSPYTPGLYDSGAILRAGTEAMERLTRVASRSGEQG